MTPANWMFPHERKIAINGMGDVGAMRPISYFVQHRDLERLDAASWWPEETSDAVMEENPELEAQLLGHICRSARALLGMSQIELADAAGLSRKTVVGVEGGYGQPDAKTVSALKHALLTKGISADFRAKQLTVSVPLDTIDPKVARTIEYDVANARLRVAQWLKRFQSFKTKQRFRNPSQEL
jgi:transcriptional regulator with XRE-family HTH domain